MRDVNHRISRKLVDYAKANDRVLALEDLTGIRKRVRGRVRHAMVNRWAFYQLRQFIGYKAAEAGVAVQFVSPAYTSQACSRCGCLGSRRKHRFFCNSCNAILDADINAARNIRHLAAQGQSVNLPEVTHPVRPHAVTSRLL
jgi:IS605 OrfB family transposase